MMRWRPLLWVGLVSLGGLPLGGCTLWLGGQQFDDPRGDGESRTRFRVEGELATPAVLGGHLEGLAAVGLVRLEASNETLLTFDEDDGEFDRVPVSDTTITDVRLGGRFYPLASQEIDWFASGVRIEPYIVGGGGYYLADRTERQRDSDAFDPLGVDSDSDTVSEGLFPYLGFGVKARFAEQWSVVLEVREDFDRLDGGRDTSGTTVMLGVRWGF